MLWLRKIFRSVLLISHILLGLILSYLIYAPWLQRFLPKHLPSFIVSRWSWILCRIFNLKITFYGKPATQPVLFVANHISWLDIFALLGTFHVIFVSKAEVAHWPVLGWLVTRVGTLYIKRGENTLTTVTEKMVQVLQSGTPVLLFPEGTSTDGQKVKRFYARLFQAAIEAEVPIQPIALRYPHSQGQGLSQVAPFIDDDDILRHIWRILGEKTIPLEIHFSSPLLPPHSPRRSLANHSHQAVLTALNLTEKN